MSGTGDAPGTGDTPKRLSRRRRWVDGPAVLRLPGERPGTRIPLEIAASYRARTRGLLGRDRLDGALLLTPASGVHTVRMRFAIDVAYLDRRLTVLAVRTMAPGRLGLPRLRSRHVLEAQAGAMARWGLRRGVTVAVEPDADRVRRTGRS
ncbi:hypothetical protein ACZ90_40195 [Streptomyces albus subsp. albus]|nr:hypothetical protein ACZ90_40195 [Streptomyces albus subsp. albus]